MLSMHLAMNSESVQTKIILIKVNRTVEGKGKVNLQRAKS